MGKERSKKLELTWAGKEDRVFPEPRILVEQPDKSYGDKNTENMLIHGDNLLALKSLEERFSGMINCIYIDPPYNTGNAFTSYDDGYEHSIWLSLMRDRLELLKNLLADDGVIFVQIDDNEQAYLRMIMDEIFGRNNFIAQLIPMMNPRGRQESKYPIAKQHEYILVYSKIPMNAKLYMQHRLVEDGAEDEYRLLGLRKAGNASLRTDRPNMYYPIYFNPDTGDISTLNEDYPVKILPIKTDGTEGRWRWAKENVDIRKKELVVKSNSKGEPDVYVKDFLIKDGESKGSKIFSVIKDVNIINDKAQAHLEKMFNKKESFDFPKAEYLLQFLLELGSKEGDLVLDSFIGTGTTAAVATKLHRRWIGIELNDRCYNTTLPRLKTVVDGTDDGEITDVVKWTGGGGFKFYELASSLVVKDLRGFDVVSKEYNGDMLAEAMCKIMGYKYNPDGNIFWKQGIGTENSYLFTTTNTLSEDYLEEISEELNGDSLLVCCGGFTGNKNVFSNITIKKIPKEILKKCEWNKPGYPLPVCEDFTDEDFEFEE